jgi:hypothetical protein
VDVIVIKIAIAVAIVVVALNATVIKNNIRKV